MKSNNALLIVGLGGGFAVMLGAINRAEANTKIVRSAELALERLTREIQGATTINDLESEFDSHPGKLALEGFDEEDNEVVIEFYLDGDNMLMVTTDGGLTEFPLLVEDLEVTNLIFRKIES